MSMPRISDIRKLTDEELNQEIVATKKLLFNLRMQKGIGRLKKTHQFKHAKHRLAQLLTIEQERQRDRSKRNNSLHVYDYSKVSFPEKVRVGRVYSLDVTVRAFSEETASSAAIKEPRTINAYLVVSPVDFDLKDSNVKTIELGQKDKTQSITFELIPKREGEKKVGVEFFQRSSYLGRADLKTKAVF